MIRYGQVAVALVVAIATIVTLAVKSIGYLHIRYSSDHEGSVERKYLGTASAQNAPDSLRSVNLSTNLTSLQQQISVPSTTVTITLQAGWNSVYLPIQPNDNNVVHLFEGIPLGSVWFWNRRSPVSMPANAADLQLEQPDWLTYFPTDTQASTLPTLFALEGGRGYLIQLDGDEPVNWVVTGQPLLPATDWIADSYNLIGFHIDPNNAPTFEAYFDAVDAPNGKPIYQLDVSGQWREIASLATERIQPNHAYWVYSDDPSTYTGPLSVTLDQGRVLDYGKVLDEQTLQIQNKSTEERQISIRYQENEPYLVYWGREGDAERWLNFPHIFSVPAHEELTLRLAVRRSNLADSTTLFHHRVLEITDNQGVSLHLPVIVESVNIVGLWVGTTILNKVSEPASGAITTTKPTGSEFQFRLLVHVDAAGQARLLQQVTLMWKEGTERPDPVDPSKKIVDRPGEFVLVTRDDLLSQFSGSAIRDSQLVGRRISSAAFSFQEPVDFNGEFGSRLQSAPITIDYDDPLNPFKHKYHPNHDNLDSRFETSVPEGKESFTIIRQIELEFTAEDPAAQNRTNWGSNQMGGIYRETIQGVHKDTLRVEGTFRLQLVSTIATLNDGQ